MLKSGDNLATHVWWVVVREVHMMIIVLLTTVPVLSEYRFARSVEIVISEYSMIVRGRFDAFPRHARGVGLFLFALLVFHWQRLCYYVVSTTVHTWGGDDFNSFALHITACICHTIELPSERGRAILDQTPSTAYSSCIHKYSQSDT